MKKVFLGVFALMMMFNLSSQNIGKIDLLPVRGEKKVYEMSNAVKEDIDTLGLNLFKYSTIWPCQEFTYGNPAIYQGYLYGTNAFLSTFAQGYMLENQVKLLGVMVWHGSVNIKSADGCNIVIKSAKIDGTSSYSGLSTICPSTIVDQVSFNIKDIDTSRNGSDGIIIKNFETQSIFEDDIALIYDASACQTSDDTVAVCMVEGIATSFGGSENYAWLMSFGSNPYWVQMNHLISNYMKSPGIFPIVDYDIVGINENEGFFQNYQLSFYPNPAVDFVNVEYALKEDANTNVMIISQNGTVVYKSNNDMKNSGITYSENIDISKFAAGTYYISVGNDSKRLTKPFIVK